MDDLPYVFKFVKDADGEHYNVQNFKSGLWWMRYSGQPAGAGFGLGDTPAKFGVKANGAGWVLTYEEDDKPSSGNCVHAQSDGFVGFWGNDDNIYAHKVWNLVAVDTTSLFHPVKVTDVDKVLPDGYYFINFRNYEDPTTCLVPTNSSLVWTLSAYPRDDADYDDAYIWHITCNKADTTYTIKNCGSQDFTYIENETKGNKESPVILMTGTNPAKFKIRFKSDGSAYLFSTDNDYNYSINISTGNIVTSKAQTTNSAVTFVEVPAARITNALKLQEAISEAKGRQFTVGSEPGQVSQESYNAFKAVLDEATAAWEKDEDHSDEIKKLNDATEAINSERVPISDGYYYFINREDSSHYLKPVFKGGLWYLGHEDVADRTLDPSVVWHITAGTDGKYIMKNCGVQDSTYFAPVNSGYNWGYVTMTGAKQGEQTLKNLYTNFYKIYTDGNHNFLNGDYGSGFNGNLITTNNDYHEKDGSWIILRVPDEEMPFLSSLNEAITDAKGAVSDMNIGHNPGDNKGDTTAIMPAIREAEAMYADGIASDDEVKAEITKLNEAVKAFLAEDHSRVGIEDGYYYIVSRQYSFQKVFGENYIAMRSDITGYMKWQVLDPKDPRYLFHITPLADGTYAVKNVLYDKYITKNDANGISTDTAQTVGQTFTEAGYSTLSQGANKRLFFYMANAERSDHYSLATYKTESSGAIALSKEIDTWRLDRLTDQVLLDSLLKASEQQRLTEGMSTALASAEPAYKAVFRWNADHDSPLLRVTDEDDPHGKGQIWGTQEPSAAGAGGYSSYANLIDGNLSSCFQSTWNSGILPGGKQQLQFDLQNHPVQNFQFYFGLRNGDWGYRECWKNIDLYATNDQTLGNQDETDFSQWTHVGNYNDFMSYIRPVNYSQTGNDRKIYYDITGMDNSYRFLRFVINSTAEPQAAGMYTIGETQIYELVKDDENSPYAYVDGLKALADELKTLIDNGRAHVAANTVTADELARIQEVTAKVIALTPNTEGLDTRITEVKNYVDRFSDNDELGDVSSNDLEAILNAIEEAEAYDHDKPQMADLTARLDALNKAFDAFKAAQKQPSADTWYYIVNTDKSRVGQKGYDEGGTGAIWDRFCYGNVIIAPHTNATHYGQIFWGGYNRSAAAKADSVEADPYAMWRLVKIEGNDAANVYALQNRANGKYMDRSANHWGRIAMSNVPSPYLFTVVKSGQVQITCQDPVNTDKTPLHAAGDGYLCTWEANADSPSSWNLEPVSEDVVAAEITVRNNNAMILTLPYAYTENEASFNADNGIKTYEIKGVSEDGSKLELHEKKAFEAGEPMIVIAGDLSKYGESTDSIRMCIPLANTFTSALKTANGLIGTADTTDIESSFGIIFSGKVKGVTDAVILPGMRGYIDAGQITNNSGLSTDATIDIEGMINSVRSIESQALSGKVNVYSIDGVLLKKDIAPADAVRILPRGTYIIGKRKVLVK